jgi:hypothetical protein
MNNEDITNIVEIINNFIIETRKQSDNFHKAFTYWFTNYITQLNNKLKPIIDEISKRENEETNLQ